MKGVTIYKSGDSVVIVPKGRAPSGWITGRLDMVLVENAESPNVMQKMLISALDKYDQALSDDLYDNKRFGKTLSSLLGKRSYSAFLKDAASVEVAVSEREVILQPLKSSSSFKGMESFQDITETLPLCSLNNEKAAERIISMLIQVQASYEQFD